MKVKTTTTHTVPVEAEITPEQAIRALRNEITQSINTELRSLKLPDSELCIPHGGFEWFYIDKTGLLMARHKATEHYPIGAIEDTEIKWGAARFKNMLYYYNTLGKLLMSGIFAP